MKGELTEADGKIHKLMKSLKGYKHKAKQHDHCATQLMGEIRELSLKVASL